MTNISPGPADKANRVRQSVLDDLRRGRLLPCDIVSITALAKSSEAQVTATPVREALRQLVGEGALAEHDTRGFRVPHLLPGAVRSIYAAQELLALAMLEALVDAADAPDGRTRYAADELPADGSMDAWFALLQTHARHPGLERAWRPLGMALICYRRVEQQVVPEITGISTRMRLRFEQGRPADATADLRCYFQACAQRAGHLCERVERSRAPHIGDIFQI